MNEPTSDDEPTPPLGTPALTPREIQRRSGRRNPPAGERHERLLMEMIERIEARMNRRSRD